YRARVDMVAVRLDTGGDDSEGADRRAGPTHAHPSGCEEGSRDGPRARVRGGGRRGRAWQAVAASGELLKEVVAAATPISRRVQVP
ncbi:hypothetical protein ACNQUF_11670, partial [Corynebacterium diphtheriae]